MFERGFQVNRARIFQNVKKQDLTLCLSSAFDPLPSRPSAFSAFLTFCLLLCLLVFFELVFVDEAVDLQGAEEVADAFADAVSIILSRTLLVLDNRRSASSVFLYIENVAS
jgi:hypothetical protein